jgi:lipopolysaccharide biosynthesis regulator YciM
MTVQQARQKMINKISKMDDTLIIAVLKDMAKPWDKYTEQERMVKAYLYDEYEKRNGEDAVDMLLDIIEELEESRR